MDPLVTVIGAVGVLATLFAFWRTMSAVRSGASRDLVLGWMALMVGIAAVTTVLIRLL